MMIHVFFNHSYERHNAIEHGGNMSRSKRNAALQIPTSFRYRRSEQEQRRGRGRGFRNDSSDNQLAMAIQASLEAANVDRTARGSFTSAQADFEHRQPSQIDVTGQLEPLDISPDSGPPPVIEESLFPPLSDREPTETSSRYAQALIQGSSSTNLREESFPPLPGSVEVGQPQPNLPGKKTIAAHLRQRSKMYLKSAQAKPAGQPGLQPFMSVSSPQLWPTLNQESGPTTSTSSSQPRTTANQVGLSSNSSSSREKTAREAECCLPNTSNSAWTVTSTNRLSHSTSAPNLVGSGSSHNSSSISATFAMSDGMQTREQSLQSKDDVRTANKTLVDRIRHGLGMDEDKFAAFKNISAEYRQGLIGTFEYLSYVEQFGLLHLVPELARLCPDAPKQKELIDIYNVSLKQKDKASLPSKGHQETSASGAVKQTKGKGKSAEPAEGASSKDALADSIMSEVKKIQLQYKPQEELEVLSKDGYRTSKGKSMSAVNEEQSNSASVIMKSNTSAVASDQHSGAESSKQRPKKTSKFHRVRLGDGSAAAIFDLDRLDANPERTEETDSGNVSSEGLPVKGVWRYGGGQKLISTSRGPSK
uniref:Zinc finger protein 598 n=1 Tax=Anthurium amnicola TaxID=1678845 RepID=A0A1D1XDL1_9ARAE